MEKHFELRDPEFELQFANCTLDPTLFSHEAHLRLAWIHVRKYGAEKACENICKQIQRFDMVHDKGTKFHKTLTVASIKAVYHFMLKSKSDTFHDFMQEFPRLKHNFKDLLGFHYGFDVFNPSEAKSTYLEPDLLPFD